MRPVDLSQAPLYNQFMTIEQTIEIQVNRRLELDLPFELPLGRARMELTIGLPRFRCNINSESAFGCLRPFANPSKIPGEKGAWTRAAQ
jgi:hypothetical protein